MIGRRVSLASEWPARCCRGKNHDGKHTSLCLGLTKEGQPFWGAKAAIGMPALQQLLRGLLKTRQVVRLNDRCVVMEVQPAPEQAVDDSLRGTGNFAALGRAGGGVATTKTYKEGVNKTTKTTTSRRSVFLFVCGQNHECKNNTFN